MKRHLALLLVAIGSAAFPALATPSVVITEVMYRAISDIDGDDFLEIQNTGPTSVDLQGWCLDGAAFCFPAGASIGPGEWRVLAADAARFGSAYGFAPDWVFAGNLSNSGERLALVDGVGAVVDEVIYADLPPWPVTPDGLGPSLEVIDPALDNATPRNWRACVSPNRHTARAANSVAATGLPPWITEATHTQAPQPQDPVVVTARILDASSASLFYVFGFGTEVELAMLDDGQSQDGAAGDGVYGAVIPGQPAATLVRYRIRATGPAGIMAYPRTDDTITYTGTAVADPALASSLPVFHWYMDPARYAAAISHRYTDQTEPAVFFYNGVLWDNVQVRVRGQSSRSYPKNHWKFRLPHGHDFLEPTLVGIPLDQFDLQGNYSDKSYLREILAYGTFRDVGTPSSATFAVRIQQNGSFYGLYTFLQALDDDYLASNGMDENGAWYKALDDCRYRSLGELPGRYEKQTRLTEDHSDLLALLNGVNNLAGQAKRDFLFDNVDIPAMLNYLAATVVIHNTDFPHKNYYLYRDTEGTQRWSMQPWDQDLTFGRNWQGTVLNDEMWADRDTIAGKPAAVSPSHPLVGESEHQNWDTRWNKFVDALYENSEIRQMYYRRLRSLMDEWLAPGRYESLIDAQVPLIQPEADLDRVRWGQYGQAQTLAQAVSLLKNSYLAVRRTHLFTTHRVAGEIPAAQSAAPRIVISELMYLPATGPDGEFVELFNPSATEEVDLSGWRLEGVALTIPPGTVILPQQYLVLARGDTLFRTLYGGGRFVAAQYAGALNDTGEAVILRDPSGREVASVAFSNLAPWPAAAAGGGPSLELIDASQANGWVANWAASAVPGGTPGAANSAAGALPPFPGLFLNEILPVNASVNVDEAGDHDPWIEIWNGSGAPVELGGMSLTDDLATPAKWTFPEGTVICAGCWRLVWADNEQAEGPAHAGFRLSAAGGIVALFAADGRILDSMRYGAIPANVSFGRFPDGSRELRSFGRATPGASNDATPVPMILNEYNGVAPGSFLKGGASDTWWGRRAGNGGDWFELVVTQDRLDARGWTLTLSDDTGGAGQTVQTLTLSNDPLWADLRSGTILTISEDLDDNVSFDPASGDWWINVRASSSRIGPYITNQNFHVSNSNWQLTIKDTAGNIVFGPVGEGIAPLSGIGNDEVCKLEEAPTPYLTPLANYNDGTSSTFGAPNLWSGATLTQTFDLLRCTGQACALLDTFCAIGVCNGATGQCELRPRNQAAACDDGAACTTGDQCAGNSCAGVPIDCASLDGACALGVCNPASGQCEAQPVNEGLACDDGVACTAGDLCMLGVCRGAGSCATALFQNGAGYTGTHDTYLHESSPDAVHGGEDHFEWDGSDGTPPGRTIGLLRFDGIFGTGPGQIPAGSPIASATLQLEVSNFSIAPAGEIREALADWDQAVATWNNFGGEPGVQEDERGAVAVARTPLPLGPAWVDVTAGLGSWSADPAGNRGWIFLPDAANTNGADVRASEYATESLRPKLTVRYVTAASCAAAADCDDLTVCTGSESCVEGTCVGGAPLDCGDANPCTDDLCNPASGCSHSNNTASCEDGNICTTDQCGSGTCQHAASGACGIAGTVRYYRSHFDTGSEPSAKPVPGIGIDTTGDGTAEATTDTAGVFVLAGRSGNVDVRALPRLGSPRAADHNEAITSFDAALIARFAVEDLTPSANQAIAADVTGNGEVSSFDAARVAQFAVEQIDHFDVAVATGSDWRLLRCDTYESALSQDCGAPLHEHHPIDGPKTDNFHAVLYGEVTGNWEPSGTLAAMTGPVSMEPVRAVSGEAVGGTGESPGQPDAAGELEASRRDREVAARLKANRAPLIKRDSGAPSPTARLDGWSGPLAAGRSRDLTLRLDGADGIVSLDLVLAFVPGALAVQEVSGDGIGSALGVASHEEPGALRIAAWGVVPLAGSGTVLRIRVEALRGLGAALPIRMEVQADELPVRVTTRPLTDHRVRSPNPK